jgi:hypothetical protein
MSRMSKRLNPNKLEVLVSERDRKLSISIIGILLGRKHVRIKFTRVRQNQLRVLTYLALVILAK